MCDHLLTLHYFTNKIHAYEKIQIIKQLRLFNSVVVVRFQHFVSKKRCRQIIRKSNDTCCFPAKD